MNPSFLKFYLLLLWVLNFIAIKTPSLRIKPLKVNWFPLVVSTMRLFSMFIVMANNFKLLKALHLSIELKAILASTIVAEITASAVIQVASMIKTKDTHSLVQFALSQGQIKYNYGQPAAIASIAAMMLVLVDLTRLVYIHLFGKLKLELLDETILSTYFPVLFLFYFMAKATLTFATPFALSYVVIFGMEFVQHYENICDGLLRLSRADDQPEGDVRTSTEHQIISIKRKLKMGKKCHGKYLKSTRIYCFCILLHCCLMVLHYFAYNISDVESARFDFKSSRYPVLSVALIFLLTYAGNAAETRGSKSKLILLNARESSILRGNKKITRVVLWAGSWNCRLSALGCCDVNYSVISTVFTVVSTYFICYLQMELTAKN